MSWWGRFNCLDLTLNSMKLHIQDLLPKFIRQHFWRGTFKENSKSVTLTTEHCKTNILVNNTFSTVISRPSSTERFKYLIQRSAPSTVSIVTNAKPRDSLVRGSVTKWHSVTWNKICKGLFHKTKKKQSKTIKLKFLTAVRRQYPLTAVATAELKKEHSFKKPSNHSNNL